ncbi:SpoIID/LytB domain-containing protein [Nocardioides nematodiphilus]|uniref:SpoIID/LytB domain-containing protein n=1 Tax=Nocardioides nematodiphilus TaxID=2849669 RepID=UPI001CD998C9|nr:SpoIID/LytB domain-containing protein [Nocardioides nematodiphilus]MCA1983578.1 SpoIID/LytB domain-containing protein [Nocardioides nematodiphilus]
MSRRVLGKVAALLALCVACASVTAAPAEARARRDSVITTPLSITGYGFGHGHGMSQYGAKGAAEQGLTYRQIVGFYYPGTTWGTATGSVRVLITADTTRAVAVLPRAGLSAERVDGTRRWNLDRPRLGAKRWRIVPEPGGRSRIDYLAHGWHALRRASGDLQFSAGGAPISLLLPGGATVAYRGVLRSASPHPGGLDRDTVNVVSLESYLKGVVPREMPALWSPQAVRAQAVAARTYAAFERADQHGYYQLCDTSACQVYGGYSGEYPASNEAVTATTGQILTYAGEPAFTQFSASNGGASMAGGMPYLVSKPDPYDTAASPYRGWKVSVAPAAVERMWPRIGRLTAVAVTRSTHNAPGGGYVSSVAITGTTGSVNVSGDAFRSFAGLRSSWFAITLPNGATTPSPTPSTVSP